MGLIIKDKIQELMKGYPTVSDKYNVSGAVLKGSSPAKFGELVKFGSTKGYFAAITSALSSVADIAGFVLATNVKLNELWPEGNVQVNPGEAFNLLINGFIAVELDDEVTVAQILANRQVHVILATGKLTTADKYSSGVVEPLPNCVFTGVYENQGSAASPKYIAEIYVK